MTGQEVNTKFERVADWGDKIEGRLKRLELALVKLEYEIQNLYGLIRK